MFHPHHVQNAYTRREGSPARILGLPLWCPPTAVAVAVAVVQAVVPVLPAVAIATATFHLDHLSQTKTKCMKAAQQWRWIHQIGAF